MRLLIGIVAFLLCVSTIEAQKITVISKSNNEPIPGVAVYNKSKSISKLTDFDGVVDITDFYKNGLIYFSHISHAIKSIKKFQILKNGITIYLTPDNNQLSEVIISVSKWKQDKKDISQKIVSLSSDQISFATPQTSADLLQSSGQVYIQKSQLGGGSPIIRGFSTNRLLLTVDGVRMNNAIFRGGNVQNVVSIDPFTIDRTEVILGPGSVVYGSDAVGGVMNFYTAQPKFGIRGKDKISSNFIGRYASASNEKTGHIDVNFGLEKWAFLSSVSYTDFDDLKMGSYGPDDYLRNEFVGTQNGEDVIIQNPDPETQVFTGYDQINFLQKIHYIPNEFWDLNAGFIYTTTSDYPRYDRLIRRGDDNQLRSAEWFYGPQQWLMGNLQTTHKKGNNFYDRMKIIAAYQHFEESRHERDFAQDTLGITRENVDAYSLSLDFEKKVHKNTTFYYGLEYILNQVGSRGSRRSIRTNETIEAQSRYPSGSTWQSIAAYASFKNRFSDKLRFQGGLRYNKIVLYSEFDKRFFDFESREANLAPDALTGTAGFSWLTNDFLHWKVNFSTAFRAPNIDDIGKVFESEAGSITVPNPDLKPEYAYNGELGCILKLHKNFSFDVSTYYTRLDRALVRRDFVLDDGRDQIDVNGNLLNVQAIQNAANATIYGFEAGVRLDFAKHFRFSSQYTFTGGEEELDDGSIAPARHVAPQFGNTSITYTRDRWMVDVFGNYNGKFDFEDLAPSQQNNAFLYAKDENGNPFAPSWYTLNLRSRFKFTKKLEGTMSIENITDQRYRPYSSGIAAAGRNFIMSLQYSL